MKANTSGFTIHSAAYKALSKRLRTALVRRLDSRKEALDKISRSRLYQGVFPISGRISLKDGQEFVFELRPQPEKGGQKTLDHKIKNRKVLMEKLD